MDKKIAVIFCMLLLMVSSLSVNFVDISNVKASGDEQNPSVNLDYDYIWNKITDFSNVVYTAYGENDIPMGRAWASKGENFTIDVILQGEMSGPNNPCGLSEYQELQLGFVPGGGITYKPKLVITYRNQSKIKDTGSTDIKGYLLIQVQYYETGKGVAPRWVVDNDTINETYPRTINSSDQLALDTIFNGHVRASDLTHGTGTYRVYAAFRDPEGNILRTNDDIDLDAWWQFSKT